MGVQAQGSWSVSDLHLKLGCNSTSMLCHTPTLTLPSSLFSHEHLHHPHHHHHYHHHCHTPPHIYQFDESLIASLANEDLVDSLLKELQEDFPQLLKPLLHDRCVRMNTKDCLGQHKAGNEATGRMCDMQAVSQPFPPPRKKPSCNVAHTMHVCVGGGLVGRRFGDQEGQGQLGPLTCSFAGMTLCCDPVLCCVPDP